MAFGLVQALRRQLDAHDVDIDTFAGYVRFNVYPPSELRVDLVRKLVDDAGFTARKVEVTLHGAVEEDGYLIRLRGTDQEIVLEEPSDEVDLAHIEM